MMNKKIIFTIPELDCSSCVIAIDEMLEGIKGIISARTSYVKQQTIVTYDAALVSPNSIAALLQQSGYAVQITR